MKSGACCSCSTVSTSSAPARGSRNASCRAQLERRRGNQQLDLIGRRTKRGPLVSPFALARWSRRKGGPIAFSD